MGIYTDLAAEARELDGDNEGVIEETLTRGDVIITRIEIVSERAEKRLGKRKGKYVSIDAWELAQRLPGITLRTENYFAEELSRLITPEMTGKGILAVGLGNRSVTPDSLGPLAADGLFVTRHIKCSMPDALEYDIPSLSSIAPGVLGTTGLESAEQIKWIAEELRPGVIIAIDSLASRRASRISTTIQLSDAGIEPGSGVGNLRSGINRDLLGIPVIAVGVPLVVRASTIISDALKEMAGEDAGSELEESIISISDKVASERMDAMIMTPKDIDSIVGHMAEIVANGINKAVFGKRYEYVKELYS